jgi:outer membrane protein TolC
MNRHNFFKQHCVAGVAFSLLQLSAVAQLGSAYPNAPSSSQSSTFSVPLTNRQNPFNGSVAQEKLVPGSRPLSFKDAIDLALKNNLGVLLQSDQSLAARGQKWKELAGLLPNITAEINENIVQENLAALGLRIPGFPTIIGPFGYFDARAYLKQSVFDLNAINRVKSASASERAAELSYKDARDLVVLAVGNAYLQTLAGAARVETAEAQVQTAQALFDKADDQLKAGVSPAIDSLRARVEFQSRQQQAIVARNDYAKQKLALLRAIGLPTGQEITLTDQAPYEPLVTAGFEEDLRRAYLSRFDYLSAAQQLRAAEYSRKAATAKYFPDVSISANYGDLGVNIGNSHGTYTVAGGIHIPIFEGGKTQGEVMQSDATLRQSRQQLEDIRAQVEYDVRVAFLDLAAAKEQVEVARSTVDLANQTMIQARDRFTAGVTDNLEVVQAQEAVASANESYISSLYAHNLAKVSLARAIGFAEQGVKEYLKSK